MAFTFLWNGSKKFVKRLGKFRIGAQGDSCCCGGTPYKQARRCSDDTLADVWMTTADAALFPDKFTVLNGDVGYYFSSDTGTPGTVYAAADAQPYANCVAAEACGSGDCDDPGVCVNLVGAWPGLGGTPTGHAASAEPLSPVFDDGCAAEYEGEPGFGTTYLDNGAADTVGLGGLVVLSAATGISTGTSPVWPCEHWMISVPQALGTSGFKTVFYRGPLENGSGSRVGRYYWAGDGESTTFDENGIATDGYSRGTVPASVEVESC